MATSHEAQMPFIKNLAQSDRVLRTAALESLQTFLSSRKSLSPTDATKLWKGLYYALWMTDRPIPQQRLAADLAALTHRGVRPSCAPAWFEGFWTVMGMEWTNIDHHRMQKFLLLTRRVFASMVQFVKARGYKGKEVEATETVMKEWCFEEGGTDLRRVPVGVRMHCLDVVVDELEKEDVLKEEEEGEEGSKAREFVERVGDMIEALRRSPIKPVRARAGDVYEDERLPWVTVEEKSDDQEDEDGGEESDDGWGGFDD